MYNKISDYKARIIYSQRLAGYLMQRGFVLARMDKNDRYPNRNIFIFKDTALLSDAIENYNQHR